jgi:hypothetical protein
MEEKLKIHQSMVQTKTALKSINKLSEQNNVQLNETPEVNSPAWTVESAAGQNIPSPANLYGLTQLGDIQFGAHGYTSDGSKKKGE